MRATCSFLACLALTGCGGRVAALDSDSTSTPTTPPRPQEPPSGGRLPPSTPTEPAEPPPDTVSSLSFLERTCKQEVSDSTSDAKDVAGLSTRLRGTCFYACGATSAMSQLFRNEPLLTARGIRFSTDLTFAYPEILSQGEPTEVIAGVGLRTPAVAIVDPTHVSIDGVVYIVRLVFSAGIDLAREDEPTTFSRFAFCGGS